MTSEEKNNEKTSLPEAVAEGIIDSTLPAPIRKNLFKALNRLSTATIEIPVAYLEGKADEIRAGTRARVKLIEKTSDQIAQQMKVDPVYARAAVEKLGQKVIREQVNLDQIVFKAAEDLKKNPSPKDERNLGSKKTINDDFLTAFEKEASQKSTEEMQAHFGKVLAGEIRSPGSFSIRSLKILGQMDQSVAMLFAKFCSCCIVANIPRLELISRLIKEPISHFQPEVSKILDARVCSMGGSPGQNSLQKFHLSFDQLNTLQEYGLIIADYNSWFDYGMAVPLEGSGILLSFYHASFDWLLLPMEGYQKGELRVPGVALTNTGKEIFPIVPITPMEEYTVELKKYFEGQKLKMTKVESKS